MPGCFGCTCMLVCAFLSASCTRDRGCQPAPGIPCALSFSRANFKQASGVMRRENAEVYLVGWVERSDTHQMPVRGAMGIAALHPSYALRSR